MKPDRYIDELIQPVVNLYNQMELDLIKEIAKRFAVNDTVGGALEWQVEKLKALGGLNTDAVKIISQYSKKSEKLIRAMLFDAGFVNIDFGELGDGTVTPEILKANPALKATYDNTVDSLMGKYKKINTTALESVQGRYINTLNKAYLDVASGMTDYNTAIKNAVKQMARNGIEGAVYWRGDVAVHYSLEGTVRRDTLTAVFQCCNEMLLDTAKEYNCDKVEVSQHIGARIGKTQWSNHFGWQGKVYDIAIPTGEEIPADDKVWAQELTGQTELEQRTGYGDIEGLSGVNCRHRMYLYFEGFSKPKKLLYNEEENKKEYENTQRQRKLERDIRSLKKQIAAMQELGTEEANKELRVLRIRLNKKYDEINLFCKQNGLNRDYSRELVLEQI